MTHTPKECLKKLAHRFLIELDKLEYSSGVVRNRHAEGSIFLDTDDLTSIENRTKVMDFLFKPVSEAIFNLIESKGKKKPFFSVQNILPNNINLIDGCIDQLDENECTNVLKLFLETTNAWKSDTTNTMESDFPSTMTYDQRQTVLSAHSFNDGWFFTFLAKLTMMIEKTLGMKTTSEKLLENATEEINSLGIKPSN